MFQRRALYLGELNDSQRAEWQRAVEALDDDGNVRQLKLFPEESAPDTDDGQVLRIRMDRLAVRNTRNWGEVWLGTVLWDMLGLDVRRGALRPDEHLLRGGRHEGPRQRPAALRLQPRQARRLPPGRDRARPHAGRVPARLRGAAGERERQGDADAVHTEARGQVREDRQPLADGQGRADGRHIEDDARKRVQVPRRRAWRLISVKLPKADEDVTPETFTWRLDWEGIREARAKDEGTYLLRTNLEDCDPKTLWRKYMIQGEIEYAFRELKGDLGLRPVCHQLEDRIEAHIFTSFMALCLLTTLRAIAREHAPGLTPRQIIDKMKTVKMVDVLMPTTDGRVVTLPRYVEPKEYVALLLGTLGFTLPAQPPPKISGCAVAKGTAM